MAKTRITYAVGFEPRRRSLAQKFDQGLQVSDSSEEDSEYDEEEEAELDPEEKAAILREKLVYVVKNFLQQVQEGKAADFIWPDCPIYKYGWIDNCINDLSPEMAKSETAKLYVDQVRGSSGYDVNCVPPDWMDCNLSKINLDCLGGYTRWVDKAKACLMDRINTEAARVGKEFELVKLHKVVEAGMVLFLMTVTLKEVKADTQYIVRATVSNAPPYTHPELLECKLKDIVYPKSE